MTVVAPVRPLCTRTELLEELADAERQLIRLSTARCVSDAALVRCREGMAGWVWYIGRLKEQLAGESGS